MQYNELRFFTNTLFKDTKISIKSNISFDKTVNNINYLFQLNFFLVHCNALYNISVNWILTEPGCWNEYLNLGQYVRILYIIFNKNR